MLFPLTSYPSEESVFKKLKQGPIFGINIIDLMPYIGDTDDVIRDFAYQAELQYKKLKFTAEEMAIFLKRVYPNPESSEFSYAAKQKDMYKNMQRLQKNIAIYKAILWQLEKGNLSFFDDSTAPVEYAPQQLQLNDTQEAAVASIAFWYGVRLVNRIKDRCNFVFITTLFDIDQNRIALLLMNIPAVLGRGVIDALKAFSTSNRRYQLALTRHSLKQVISAWRLEDGYRLKDIQLYVTRYEDVIDSSNTCSFLINPSYTDAEKFKKNRSSDSFLVVSEDSKSLFFEIRDDLYHETSLKEILEKNLNLISILSQTTNGRQSIH